LRWLLWLATFGLAALAGPATAVLGGAAFAQEFQVSVKVDKTTAEVGDPLTFTLTLAGDLASVDLSRLEFPPEFTVAGRSQSTNFAMRSGAVERSMVLAIVLVPQEPGTFQLGPFTLKHGKQEFETEPIEVTVKKAPLPPKLQPHGGRFTL
jgi:uncharacterized protein (DUF58 family)